MSELSELEKQFRKYASRCNTLPGGLEWDDELVNVAREAFFFAMKQAQPVEAATTDDEIIDFCAEFVPISNSQQQQYLALYRAIVAASRPSPAAEAVPVYEYRIKHTNFKNWSPWTECDKAEHDQYIAKPNDSEGWAYEARTLYLHPPATPKDEAVPVAWSIKLVDRADGVKGHFAIGRQHEKGYMEYWNLRSNCWAACSDDVLTLEEAQELLRSMSPPNERSHN